MLNFIDFNSPFLKKKINLGLDLQGGSYLLLEVDTSLLEEKAIQSKVIPLKKTLKKLGLFFILFILKNNVKCLFLFKFLFSNESW